MPRAQRRARSCHRFRGEKTSSQCPRRQFLPPGTNQRAPRRSPAERSIRKQQRGGSPGRAGQCPPRRRLRMPAHRADATCRARRTRIQSAAAADAQPGPVTRGTSSPPARPAGVAQYRARVRAPATHVRWRASTIPSRCSCSAASRRSSSDAARSSSQATSVSKSCTRARPAVGSATACGPGGLFDRIQVRSPGLKPRRDAAASSRPSPTVRPGCTNW